MNKLLSSDKSTFTWVLARCCLIAIAMAFGATGAAASCDNRPGTPDNVTAVTLSSTSIKFSWRNTTGLSLEEPNMYFDMFMRDAAGNKVGDLTGTGPFSVSFHSISTKIYDGLRPNSKYCFALRARNAAGTQGCVSLITSNWACATTLAVGPTCRRRRHRRRPRNPPLSPYRRAVPTDQ